MISTLTALLIVTAASTGSGESLTQRVVSSLRGGRPFHADTAYLVVQATLGGCNRCVAKNQHLLQSAIRCMRGKASISMMQLVPVLRAVEFRAMAEQYDDIPNLIPDIGRTISKRYFNDADGPVGYLLYRNREIPIPRYDVDCSAFSGLR